MTQYISTSTKNILEYKDNQFHFRGVSFPGLVDVEANALYDHPSDSFAEHVGLPTALEQGLIMPIQGEAVSWRDKLPWLPKLGDVIPTLPQRTPAYA